MLVIVVNQNLLFVGGKSGVIRWGIVSAGLIATDFCLALRTLSPDEHQVCRRQLIFCGMQ